MPPRKRRQAQQPSDHGHPSSNPNQPYNALPIEVLVSIFSQCNHDGVFNALCTCKAWYSATNSDSLWELLCLVHGWRCKQDPHDELETWKDAYQRHYESVCYDCFVPCERKTLSFAPLAVRLCQACSHGYAARQPGQRMIAKTQAKHQWCLSDSDLQPLPYCVESNPINPLFQSMHLYGLIDIRTAALAKFETVEAVEKERRRRLTRR